MAIGRLVRQWRIAVWAAGIAAATAIGVWGVPALIRAAYAGESWPLFNRVISGQSSHPVEYYLDAWQLAFVGIGVSGLAVALLLAFRRRPLFRRIGRRLSAEPAWSPRRTLGLAVWVGTLAGLTESGVTIARYELAPHISRPFQWEAMWMAPWSAALAFAVLALAGLGVTWLVGRRRGASLWAPGVIFVLALPAIAGVLAKSPLVLAPVSAGLLAAGTASMLARHARANPTRWERTVRRSLPPVAVAIVAITIVGALRLPEPLERRRLAELPPAAEGLPDIVLIILDTVRAASMGLYGYHGNTTPHLERWAEGGVVFTRAMAPAPWTLPSHASLFTGHLPRQLGTRAGVPVGDRFPTLAEILSGAGYRTAAFTANMGNTSEASGLARGFLRYEDFPVTRGRFLVSSWLAHQLAMRIPGLLDSGRLGRKVARDNTDDFLRWLGGLHGDRPFFAFLNYMDAHAPYDSPPAFRARFPSDLPVVQPVDAIGMSEEELAGSRAAYAAAIAYLDAEMNRILEALQRTGRDDAVVIISSDHGEFFGEHGLVDHGGALYTSVLWIPLIMLHPEIPQGVRIAAPVGLRDVAVTITDLALGAPDPRIGGRSFARLWRNHPGATLADPVFSETKPEDLVWRHQTDHRESVVLGSLHYIRSAGGVEELFNLATDPHELRDLHEIPAFRPTLRQLASLADSIRRSMQPRAVAEDDSGSPRDE